MDPSNMSLRVSCGSYERYGSTVSLSLDVNGAGSAMVYLSVSEGRGLKIIGLDRMGFAALKGMIAEAEESMRTLIGEGKMSALALR